jgi:hypothetical protein
MSWKVAQSEVRQMFTLKMKCGYAWIILGRLCPSVPMFRGLPELEAHLRSRTHVWIKFSRTGIGAVVMPPVKQSFNKYLFAGICYRALLMTER